MLAQSVWLSLKPETRKIIANFLGLPRTGGSEVIDGRVISDGYTPNDLATITLERLQKMFNTTDTDYYKLFNQLVHNAELPPIEIVAHVEEPVNTPGINVQEVAKIVVPEPVKEVVVEKPVIIKEQPKTTQPEPESTQIKPEPVVEPKAEVKQTRVKKVK